MEICILDFYVDRLDTQKVLIAEYIFSTRRLSSSTRSVIHLSLLKKEHKISAKMIQTFLRKSEVKIFSLPKIKIFLQTFPENI